MQNFMVWLCIALLVPYLILDWVLYETGWLPTLSDRIAYFGRKGWVRLILILLYGACSTLLAFHFWGNP